MAYVIGGKVKPHVQAFADDVEKVAKISHISTYPGHQPTLDRALDIFPMSVDEGKKVAQFSVDNMTKYGQQYLIYLQEIYNPEIGRYWRKMEDRRSPTANHMDHSHHSFYEQGLPRIGNEPKEADEMAYAVQNAFVEPGQRNGFIISRDTKTATLYFANFEDNTTGKLNVHKWGTDPEKEHSIDVGRHWGHEKLHPNVQGVVFENVGDVPILAKLIESF